MGAHKLSPVRYRIKTRKWLAALATVIAIVIVVRFFVPIPRHDEAYVVGLRPPLLSNELKVLEARADAGDPDAQLRLAHELSMYGDIGARAFSLIQRAANQHHPYAEYELGMIFSGQFRVWEPSKAEMKKYGAASSDPSMWTEEVGTAGVVLLVNHAKALQWFNRAAAQGEHMAWKELADIYEEGRGVAPDAARYATWVRKLADAGDPGGILAYARCLESGKGVVADPVQALAWTVLLIDSPYPDESAVGEAARTIARRIEGRLSNADIASAQLLAKKMSSVAVCVGGLQNCR